MVLLFNNCKERFLVMIKHNVYKLKNKLDFISANFLIYILKCIVGTSICYLFHYYFSDFRFYWSIVSVVLVISPDDIECKKLPVDRIKANIIGSMTGLVLFFIPLTNLPVLCIGIALTIFICNMIKLGSATRSALAALVIVFIQESTDVSFISAFQRMISVIVGCLTALFIHYAFDYILSFFKKSKINHSLNSENEKQSLDNTQ